MQSEDIFSLGLGLSSPWKLLEQRFEIDKNPHELWLTLGADRGALYPCPECKKLCKAHDFAEMKWRHLNFFQHICYLQARVPRVACSEHGVHRVQVPWARHGSGFTVLFEQVIMSLAREMPINAIAKFVHETDTRLWRIVHHYVFRAMSEIDLSNVLAVGLDETSSKRGHKYVTIFIDMEKEKRPVIFAVPGKGKGCLQIFAYFLKKQGGSPKNICEIVCDMSPAFIAAAQETFPDAHVTVDWFHVVKLFNDSMEEVRRKESKEEKMPKAVRWAILKGDKPLTEEQEQALSELESRGLHTATAYRIKELLRWIRYADTRSQARWRCKMFLRKGRELIEGIKVLEPIQRALNTFEEHSDRIVRHWDSMLSNARLEGFNGLFQAAKSRARGYRNVTNFITMIYLIGAPIAEILWTPIP